MPALSIYSNENNSINIFPSSVLNSLTDMFLKKLANPLCSGDLILTYKKELPSITLIVLMNL